MDDKKGLTRRQLLRGGAVVAADAAAAVALRTARQNRKVTTPGLLEKLQKEPELIDDKTAIMQQVLDDPASRYPLIFLLNTLGINTQNVELDVLTDLASPASIPNPLPHKHGQKISLLIANESYDTDTSLKASAFFEEESKTLLLVFPGTDMSTQDMAVINETIAFGKPVSTQTGVRNFIQELKPFFTEGIPQFSIGEKPQNMQIENCVILGNSLGAGSAVYALDEIMKDQELVDLLGGVPGTVLIEPWMAQAAAQATGSGVSALARHITEIRCDPPTLIDQENPAIGEKKTAMLVPATSGCTTQQEGLIGNIGAHVYSTECQDLQDGQMKIVEATKEELDSLQASYPDRMAANAIRLADGTFTPGAVNTVLRNPEPSAITLAGAAAAGGLTWVIRRRNERAAAKATANPEERTL